MDITYIGHSCFHIKGKDLSIVIDPYNPESTGFKLPKLSADIVLLSHMHDDHSYVEGVSDHSLVINSPGEFEKGGVFIYGIQSYHDENGGEERGLNTIYTIDIDGFTICHAGDLGHELQKRTLEKFNEIDLLMVPVGGFYTIDAKIAVKVISDLEPRIVIPMHYQTPELKLPVELAQLEKFLDEAGAEDVKSQSKLKITAKSDLPEETEVVVLDHSY